MHLIGSDTVSIIDTLNNSKVADVEVGDSPSSMTISKESNIVYVSNTGSDTVSVIFNSDIMTGVALNVNPRDSGSIKCNGNDIRTHQIIYMKQGTQCIAEPSNGFQFSSWTENLDNNSVMTLSKSQGSNFFIDILKTINKYEDPTSKFQVTSFGNFTANFKELPPPIPVEYLATLFAVVVSAFIGSWLTPTAI